MADPSFYEPEEDELISALAEPQFAGQDAESYEEDYRRIQELEKHAYAEHGDMAQGDELDMVHADVKRVRQSQAILMISFWYSSTRPSSRTTSLR